MTPRPLPATQARPLCAALRSAAGDTRSPSTLAAAVGALQPGCCSPRGGGGGSAAPMLARGAGFEEQRGWHAETPGPSVGRNVPLRPRGRERALETQRWPSASRESAQGLGGGARVPVTSRGGHSCRGRGPEDRSRSVSAKTVSGRREQGARGRRRQKRRHGAEQPPGAKCVTFRNRVADRDVPCEDAGLRSSAWGGDAGSPQRGPGHEGFSAPQPGDTGWPGHRGQSGTHSSWEMWAVGACAR